MAADERFVVMFSEFRVGSQMERRVEIASSRPDAIIRIERRVGRDLLTSDVDVRSMIRAFLEGSYCSTSSPLNEFWFMAAPRLEGPTALTVVRIIGVDE